MKSYIFLAVGVLSFGCINQHLAVEAMMYPLYPNSDVGSIAATIDKAVNYGNELAIESLYMSATRENNVDAFNGLIQAAERGYEAAIDSLRSIAHQQCMFAEKARFWLNRQRTRQDLLPESIECKLL